MIDIVDLWYLSLLGLGLWFLLPKPVRNFVSSTVSSLRQMSVPPPSRPVVTEARPLPERGVDTTADILPLSSLVDLDNIWVVGPKGSGKTTVLSYLLSQRSGRVIALDPHGYPGKWGPVEVVGSGREYPEIEHVVRTTVDLIDQRAKQLARGEVSEGDFPRETLLGDEWRSLVRACPSIGPDLGTILAEGRKFGVCSIIASHTDTSPSIGLYGEMDLRDCFDVILYLGGAAFRRGGDQIPIGTERPAWAVFPQLGFSARVLIPELPPLPKPIPSPDLVDLPLPQGEVSVEIVCPHCGNQLRNRQQRAAAYRLGYCPACKEKQRVNIG